MKKSGVCIKCNCSEVYSNQNEHPRGERSVMAGPGGKISTRLFIQVYICLDCGYFEEYVEDSDLTNEKKISKIKSSWKKVV
ncbi:MAG: putative nucleic-acid-binding Zn-ribbon protein [Crocinitomicaceae bacterium]|jgi:predicted nucleic-acid-binding Zn-ribbon protein